MKRTKCWIVVALLAGAFSAQAAVYYWSDTSGDDWNIAANWTDLGTGSAIPGPTDHALMNSNVGHTLWPTISTNVPNPGVLGVGWDSPEGTLNVVTGGHVTAGTFRVGHNSTGTLNMSGGVAVGGQFDLGEGTGSGFANLTGNAILHAAAVDLEAGSIRIADSAQFMINGDQTSNVVSWMASGFIVAFHPEDMIFHTYDTTNARSVFTAILDPAYVKPEYVFFDDFNTADTTNANSNYISRQANGLISSVYSGQPSLYNITGNKLEHYRADALSVPIDLSSYIAGKEFELSSKIAVEIAGTEWSSFYLYDETNTGDARADSRLGLYIPGNGEPWACVIYKGIGGVQEIEGVGIAEVEALTGVTYLKSAEHTFEFLSQAGTGGTNTYDLVIDGQTLRSGVPYYFDGSERRIGIVGNMSLDPAERAFYDDIYLKVPVGLTYEDWAADVGLVGPDALRDADLENGGLGDGMENLLEYVLGGDPIVDDAAAVLPTTDYSTTDTITYVFRRRVDAASRGLSYDVVLNITGLQTPWSNVGNSFEVGTGSINFAFESVTNSFDITGYDTGFLNLEITEN